MHPCIQATSNSFLIPPQTPPETQQRKAVIIISPSTVAKELRSRKNEQPFALADTVPQDSPHQIGRTDSFQLIDTEGLQMRVSNCQKMDIQDSSSDGSHLRTSSPEFRGKRMLDFSDLSNSNELRIAKFPSNSTQGDEPKPFRLDSNPSSESRQ